MRETREQRQRPVHTSKSHLILDLVPYMLMDEQE